MTRTPCASASSTISTTSRTGRPGSTYTSWRSHHSACSTVKTPTDAHSDRKLSVRAGVRRGELGAQARLLLGARTGYTCEEKVGDRGQVEGRERRRAEAADDDPAERVPRLRPGATREDQRHTAEHGREHRHHDRAQADA